MKNRMFLALATLVGIIAWAAVPQRSMLQEMRQNGDEPSQTFTVTNTDPSGAGSLSQAITSANANPGLDTINFNLPGSGIQFFFTMATLPAVTDPVVIDGTTQPGYAGTPLIHIEGLGISRSLDVTGSGTTVKGMSFTSNSAGASSGIVRLAGSGNHVVTGCSFGVRGDSTRPTTSSAGLLIESNGNRVGGTTAAERNYFAVTHEHQLVIQNGASSNRVTGNWFGTAPNGTRLVTNGRDAIRILNSPNNTIGGSTGTTPGGACTGECNVIAGAGNNGIFINGAAATGNRVIGNFVGLFAAGNNINPNNLGIRIENAPGNTVGGTTAAERNVITGNSGLYGVMVTSAGSTGNVITGNYIGLYTNGTSAPTPAFATLDGILLNAGSSGTRIGGTTAGERNVISGLSGNGIEIAASNGNTVQGNYIGTDATGMARSTTLSNGISIQFSDNNVIGGTQGTTLGGPCTGACNVISGNGNNGTGDGIVLNASNGNTIDGNYVGLNAAGTGPMLNGITPSGSTFDGKAVRVFNSSNNTLGRQLVATVSEPAKVPAGFRCVASAPYISTFVYIPDDPAVHQTSLTHCPTARTTHVDTLPDVIAAISIDRPWSSVTTPPAADGSYGQAAYNTINGAGFYYMPGSPPNPSTYTAPLVFSAYQGFNAVECGTCPTAGVGLYHGPIEYGADQPSESNWAAGLIIGYQTDQITPLPETDVPRPAVHADGPHSDLKIEDSRIYHQGNGPVIASETIGSFTYSDIQIGMNAGGIAVQTNSPIQFGELRMTRTSGLGMHLAGIAQQAPANREAIVSLFGVRTLVSQVVSVPDHEEIVDLGIKFLVLANSLGEISLSHEFDEIEALYLDEWPSIRLTITPEALPRGSAADSTSRMSSPIIIPRAPFDWDRDGKTDLSVYRPGAQPGGPSTWYSLYSENSSFHAQQFGSGGDAVVAADHNGDHAPNFAVWRPSSATWYLSRLGGDPASNFDAIQWGASTDKPTSLDYDADGRSDVAVFRPSSGVWYIRQSLTGTLAAIQWGAASDVLVPADYDGNGSGDVAVFRNGIWYISPCGVCALRAVQFGVAGDVPVPADYDADGKADIAVFRPSTGVWYLLRSTAGFAAYQWGTSTDVPINGDFDGDGKNDIAVWRPSTGTWWILKSGNGQFAAFQWGQNGDIPVPRF